MTATTSTKKSSKIEDYFLVEKKNHYDEKQPTKSSSSSRSTSSSTLFWCAGVVTKQEMRIDLSDAISVYSHSMMITAGDTSSIASADDSSTITSSLRTKSPHDVDGRRPEASAAVRKSALKSSHRRWPQHIRIHFDGNVQQHQHFGRHEYTTEELDACWFRGEEYDQIARTCCKEIQMLEELQRGLRGTICGEAGRSRMIRKKEKGGDKRRNLDCCPRGLESHTRLAAFAKNQNRRAAWRAVLEEQRDQWSLGVVDDEAIASRYRDASSSCRLWAIRVGQQDEKEVESSIEEEDDDDMMMITMMHNNLAYR
jgi:hypothetical protein